MNIKHFPTLYKLSKTGKPQQWTIIVEDESYYTLAGQVGGIITKSKPTICAGKNIGKSNETTDHEQVVLEAQSKWQKQIDKGYHKNIDDIDKGTSYFEPQLAHKYKDYKHKLSFPLLCSMKIDGLRMIATKYGLTTRNGKPFNSCPHIHKILKPLFDEHPDWVIDGEIYSDDIPFEKIVSLTRKKDPTTEDLLESEQICQYWIFDGVIDDKNAGFTDRFDIIKKEINKLIGTSKSLIFVENIKVNNHKEIELLHDEFVANGKEGAMIRIPDSPYENKRSKNLLKLKQFLDDEFIIVDVIEGIGNRSGMAGNIVCKMKDGRTFGASIKGGVEVNKDLLINKDKYIGKITTIRYQALTEDGLPRFPICINIDPIDR